MLDRLRGSVDEGGAAMREGLREHHWLRLFYLTNATSIVLACVVYPGDFYLEIGANPAWQRPLTLAVAYALAFAGWFLVEGFGGFDQPGSFLNGLYRARGLRWFDVVIAVAAIAALLAGWRLRFLTIPIAVVAGLSLINAVIGLLTHQTRYDAAMLAAAQQRAAPERAGPQDGVGQ